MIPIKELNEIPFSKTFSVIIFFLFSVAPANLFVYYFDKEMFLSMDFFKLMILTVGSGMLFTTSNLMLSWLMVALVAEENDDEETHMTIALCFACVIMVVTVFISCLLMKVNVIQNLIHLVITLCAFQFTVYVLLFIFGLKAKKRQKAKKK